MYRRVNTIIFHRRRKCQKNLTLRCICFIVFCVSFFSVQSAFSQWKEIASFPFIPGLVYFQNSEGHPEIGFVGTSVLDVHSASYFPAELWKTTDGGSTWRNVADSRWISGVRNIIFKDAMNGWAVIGPFSISSGEILCYRTRDGGETWEALDGPGGHASSVYYDIGTNLLFVSIWLIPGFGTQTSLVSSDEGISWQAMPKSIGLDNGFAFWDTQHGMLSTVGDASSNFYIGFRYTFDGGFTWQISSLAEEAWQPLAIPGTTIGFALCEYSHKLYRTEDYGITWSQIYQFDPSIPLTGGCIVGNLNKLFIQTSREVFASIDSGMAWESICGPGYGAFDVRFQAVGDSLYVLGSSNNAIYGGYLWLNISGNGSSPRLQIERNNATRNISVKSADSIPINIFYSHDLYNATVDSITFLINYPEEFDYLRDSICEGWSIIQRDISNTSIRYVLKRVDPSAPELDSLLLKIYFQSIVAKETTGAVTLDEINFNQDTTFRDCMVSSLSKTDSLFVDISDQCGDSILRNFITTGKILSIISIRPNPAQDEIEIDLQSAMKQDATIEIFDALGVKVFSDSKNINTGTNTLHLDTKVLPSGMYLVKVGSASQSLVINR